MPGVLQLLFGANDVTSYLQEGSVQFDFQMNQVWTTQFNLIDLTGALNPQAGQPFSLLQDGIVLATGFISQVLAQAYESSNSVNYQIQTVDWSVVTDRRAITESYLAGDIGLNVIDDINTRFLSSEGIDANTFVDGSFFLPAQMDFNPAYVRDALNQLRDISGRQWWIDQNKKLHFVLPGFQGLYPYSSFVGFSMSDNDGNWVNATMQVTTTAADFRNDQIVKTSAPVSATMRTESFVIQNSADFFLVTKFQITAAPTVTVNGVAQTVYQVGVDHFGQNGWYWTQGAAGIQQGQQIAPTVGAVVAVTYDAIALNYVETKDPNSIAARAAIEGGSGIWTNIANVPNVSDPVAAQSLASGMISRGILQTEVQFDTFRGDFVVGNLINVNINLHHLSGVFTIQRIQAQEIGNMAGIPASMNLYGNTAGTFRYTITLSQGSPAQNIGGAVQWTQRLLFSIGSGNGSGASAAAQSVPATASSTGTLVGIKEVPVGALNGTNKAFTISHVPVPPLFWLFLNGVAQTEFADPSPAGSPDFVLDGPNKMITYNVAPLSTDQHFVEYFIQLPGGTTQPTIGLFSTGVNNDGTLTPFGQPDLHWQMTVSAEPRNVGPQAVVAHPLSPFWVPNPSDAQTIAPLEDQAGPNNDPNHGCAGGDYVYLTRFNLAGIDPTTVVVQLNWTGDNECSIVLNGVTKASLTNQFGSLHPLTINADFVASVNTLAVYVHNDFLSPTGCIVEITSVTGKGTGPSPPPTAGVTVIQETPPSGALNGTNTAFGLSSMPMNGVELYLNGVLQNQGLDYTIVNAAITMTVGPLSTDVLVAVYVANTSAIVGTVLLDSVSGTQNGSNTAFTLSHSPGGGSNTVQLWLNGIAQQQGVDYTISGTAITMTVAPLSTDQFEACEYSAVGTTTTQEIPSGTLNGSNTAFTLAHTPAVAQGVMLFLNGVLQHQGVDYTISGTSITYTTAPLSTDKHFAVYLY